MGLKCIAFLKPLAATSQTIFHAGVVMLYAKEMFGSSLHTDCKPCTGDSHCMATIKYVEQGWGAGPPVQLRVLHLQCAVFGVKLGQSWLSFWAHLLTSCEMIVSPSVRPFISLPLSQRKAQHRSHQPDLLHWSCEGAAAFAGPCTLDFGTAPAGQILALAAAGLLAVPKTLEASGLQASQLV